MRRFLIIAAALIPLMGAVGVDQAEARLGGGHSFGSRGSFTYRPPRATTIAPGAAPFERSQAPSYRSGFGGGSSFAARRPFMTGLLGGFLGAGIFGLLFGGGFMHMGLGFGGLFGLLLQLLIVFFVVRWLIRRFAGGRGGAMQPSIFGPAPGAGPTGRTFGGIGPAQESVGPSVMPLQLTAQDRQAFAQCLVYVQQAWGAGDLRAISQAVTPELMRYFEEQAQTLARQGWRNRIADVQVEAMELSEAWSEGDTDFATVAMRFSMIDVTEDAAGRVVDGDPNVRALVSEVWTFTRRRGGHWVLAAIQQTR